MEIKHSVSPDEAEVSALFDVIAVPASITYGNITMQEAAMQAAKADFAIKLAELLQKAFKVGCKIGKAKANMKDKEMYGA